MTVEESAYNIQQFEQVLAHCKQLGALGTENFIISNLGYPCSAVKKEVRNLQTRSNISRDDCGELNKDMRKLAEEG